MKILYCVNLFPSTTQTFILTQMQAMHRRGHAVFVHALGRDPHAMPHGALPTETFCREVCYAPTLPPSKLARLARVVRRDVLRYRAVAREAVRPSVFGPRRCWSLRRVVNAVDLAGVVDRVQPAVVHVHFATNAEAPLCCRRAGRLGGTRFVVSFHGFDLENKPAFYPALFDAADRFTVNSDYTRGLAEAMGCPSDRIAKLPMGTDPEVFRRASPRPGEDEPLSLLFVGRLVEMKGPDLALEAFARLRETSRVPCILTLVGDGPMRDALRRRAEALGIARDVTWTGALPQEQVREAMERASVFLLPGRPDAGGRQENQGVVIQEAQAMGLPVVVSNTGGVSEGMEDGHTGFLVPPGDVEAAAARLKQLIEDPVLREDLGRRGRALVAERFNAATLAGALETMYKHP